MVFTSCQLQKWEIIFGLNFTYEVLTYEVFCVKYLVQVVHNRCCHKNKLFPSLLRRECAEEMQDFSIMVQLLKNITYLSTESCFLEIRWLFPLHFMRAIDVFITLYSTATKTLIKSLKCWWSLETSECFQRTHPTLHLSHFPKHIMTFLSDFNDSHSR